MWLTIERKLGKSEAMKKAKEWIGNVKMREKVVIIQEKYDKRPKQ